MLAEERGAGRAAGGVAGSVDATSSSARSGLDSGAGSIAEGVGFNGRAAGRESVPPDRCRLATSRDSVRKCETPATMLATSAAPSPAVAIRNGLPSIRDQSPAP